MPCGKKRKRAKIATHKRKKKLRKNRHKSKYAVIYFLKEMCGALKCEGPFWMKTAVTFLTAVFFFFTCFS